jgi:hypothetical protein
MACLQIYQKFKNEIMPVLCKLDYKIQVEKTLLNLVKAQPAKK